MAERLKPRLARVNDRVKNFTNVREEAGTGHPIAFTMDRGSSCNVTGEAKVANGEPWYPVEQGGHVGFVIGRNVDLVVREGRVNKNVQSFTNVRKRANTDADVAFRMERGSTCSILGEVVGKQQQGKPWYLVEQRGERGYGASVNIDLVPFTPASVEMGHEDETESPQGITPDSAFSARITDHITYGELVLNEEERRFDRQDQCDVALELCLFLEQVRSHFKGNPVIITSGYRPPSINRKIGGAEHSEHLYKPGCGAVDFSIANVSVAAVQRFCEKRWPYSVGRGAPNFVHIGVRDGRPRVRWDY